MRAWFEITVFSAHTLLLQYNIDECVVIVVFEWLFTARSSAPGTKLPPARPVNTTPCVLDALDDHIVPIRYCIHIAFNHGIRDGRIARVERASHSVPDRLSAIKFARTLEYIARQRQATL